jgi:uncharacterized membrane protein YtjA (UPF0391 family)
MTGFGGHSGASQGRASTIFLRALIVAVVAIVLGLAINQTILPLLFPTGLAYERVLLFKTVYGLLVALVVTPFLAFTRGDSTPWKSSDQMHPVKSIARPHSPPSAWPA